MGFLQALIGALGLIAAGVLAERYRIHRLRQGTASALSGEIAATLQMTMIRNYVAAFESILQDLEKGIDRKIPSIVDPRLKAELDPVADRHIEHFGALGGTLPERIVTFYTYLRGIRVDLLRLASGEFDNRPDVKAAVIKADLKLWADAVAIATPLVKDLQRVASEPWWRRSNR